MKSDVRRYLYRCRYHNAIAAKRLPGRLYAALLPWSFGQVRIIVGSLDNTFGFDQQIEFDDLAHAHRALDAIGEPSRECQR